MKKDCITDARSNRMRRCVECFVKEHKIDLATLDYMNKWDISSSRGSVQKGGKYS